MYGLSAKKNGHCREVTVVERFKQESMHGLSTIKSGHCREVETRVNAWTVRQKKMAVVERWPLVEVRWRLVVVFP